MLILILEDDSERIKWFTEQFGNNNLVVVNTVLAAREVIRKCRWFDVIFLDHDLGGEVYVDSDDKSGYAIVKEIVQHAMYVSQIDKIKIVIHSWNEPAAKRMEMLLKENRFNVVRKKFGNFDKGILYD